MAGKPPTRNKPPDSSGANQDYAHTRIAVLYYLVVEKRSGRDAAIKETRLHLAKVKRLELWKDVQAAVQRS